LSLRNKNNEETLFCVFKKQNTTQRVKEVVSDKYRSKLQVFVVLMQTPPGGVHSTLYALCNESKCIQAISLDVPKIPKGGEQGHILTQLENWDRFSIGIEEAMPEG
jgi:hypothetical protein